MEIPGGFTKQHDIPQEQVDAGGSLEMENILHQSIAQQVDVAAAAEDARATRQQEAARQLAAMVAAISLTYRGQKKSTKHQKINQQVLADPKDRVKLQTVDKAGVSWPKESC